MLIWIFRMTALIGAPAIAYNQISSDWKGIAAGAAIGVILVGMEYALESVNLMTMIIGLVGAISGVIVSKLFDYAVIQIDNESLLAWWTRYALLGRFCLALLGVMIAIRKVPELDELDKDIALLGKRRGKDMKILDTSVIVDGRITDICDTRFISGVLVVPRFVLSELHSLAESSDSLKRARGRRGLDILARLQESKEFSNRPNGIEM